MSFDWDAVPLETPNDYDTFTFEGKGDQIAGVIEKIRSHTFPATDKEPARTQPIIDLKTGENSGVTVFLSPADLKRQAKQYRLDVGDAVRITLVGFKRNARGSGTPAKMFVVEVKRNGQLLELIHDPEYGPLDAQPVRAPNPAPVEEPPPFDDQFGEEPF